MRGLVVGPEVVGQRTAPFAASCRWYPSLVQLARDGRDGDKARFPKFTNCWAKGLSSQVSDPLACQFTVGPAPLRHEQVQTRKHPRYGGAIAAPATPGRH